MLIVGLCFSSLGMALLIGYVKSKGEALLANRSRQPIEDLNSILGGGLSSYEYRVIILTITLISQQWLIGLAILTILGAITVAYRGQVFKTLIENKNSTD